MVAEQALQGNVRAARNVRGARDVREAREVRTAREVRGRERGDARRGNARD